MALTFYEEGNETLVGDDKQRSLHKLNQDYFEAMGQQPSPFAEGLEPTPGDDPLRSYQKIQLLKGP